MADSIDSAISQRTLKVEEASADWQGPHGDTFREMASQEHVEMFNTARDLRSDANRWADAWVKAIDELNRISHEYDVAQESSSRSIGERTIDIFQGDDSATEVGPPPEPVATPTGPDFHPTSSSHIAYN